ncbi:MAG: hypothetical protein VSS52_007465, partial [Thiotrichaceae bacterium]|nr:hypothetical protein [Thiotrichaceae bacterium]
MIASSENHKLEELEPALCAYQPKRFAELLHILVVQLPDRLPDARENSHYLGWLIYEHMLIMRQEEQQIIEDAWRKSIRDKNTEMYAGDILLPCVLRGHDLKEQLQFIEEQNNEIGYYLDYPPLLTKVDTQDLPSITES